MLQVALNGGRTKAEHREIPITAAELARDAVRCRGVGASEVHLHPRGPDGLETLDQAVVDQTVHHVRLASGLPVGVSTGSWIEPDPERRAAIVATWREPTYASVNLSEDGALDVMQVLITAGIGIEAGIWSPEDAGRLAESGFADSVVRILVEVHEPGAVGAVARASAIHSALNDYAIVAPRLQHGVGDGAWILLRDAAEHSFDMRIGFEDTVTTPRGGAPRDNADIAEEAQAIIGRAMLRTIPARPSVPRRVPAVPPLKALPEIG